MWASSQIKLNQLSDYKILPAELDMLSRPQTYSWHTNSQVTCKWNLHNYVQI